MLKTDKEVLQWIKYELSSSILQAIQISGITLYTEDILAGLCCRETGLIIAKYAGRSTMLEISSLTRGDSSKRPNDKEVVPHGFSFWQIDIDSYPDFIKSGAWKNPVEACLKAIQVLEEKQVYIKRRCPGLEPEELFRATIAAYNCGQGTIVKVIKAKQDIDSRTAHRNYSMAVIGYAECYRTM